MAARGAGPRLVSLSLEPLNVRIPLTGYTAYMFGSSECGDGGLDPGEECDDGNDLGGDGCSWTCELETCGDAQDNDADGLIDFPADPGCLSSTDLSERSPILVCDDGLDNDLDGNIDFPADRACLSPTTNLEGPECDDGIDNDGDGRIDFDPVTFADPLFVAGAGDPACLSPTFASETRQCQDGIDNDWDLRIDWDGGASAGLPPEQQTLPDPECPNPWDRSERCWACCELALVLLPLLWFQRLRRRAADCPDASTSRGKIHGRSGFGRRRSAGRNPPHPPFDRA